MQYCYTTFTQQQEEKMKKKEKIKRVQIVMPLFLDEQLQKIASDLMMSKGAVVRMLIKDEAMQRGIQ
jgi:hypothetical protein